MSTTNRVNSGKPLHGQSRSKPHDRYEEGVTTIPEGSRAKRPEVRGDHKRCSSCREHKPRTEFNKQAKSHDGLQFQCRDCQVEDKRFRRYGVTKEWYEKKLHEQNGACAICGVHITDYTYGNKAYFSIDHDHETGSPRGLLCNSCNTAIGLLKDDPKVAARAGKYLRTHHAKRSMI